LGEFNEPLNPIRLALASGMSFVARCNARDIQHTAEILEKAVKHKGFSFVEIVQDCLIFNLEANNKDKLMHKIPDNKNLEKARSLAEEWDYNNKHVEE
jgi:2-oxoglutarate ferredoxin oxidoreductase subunit beta